MDWPTIGVFFIALAHFTVATFTANVGGALFAHMKFPLITGYLLTGIVLGPFALEVVKEEELPYLTFVNQFALAAIAFSAGVELYFPEIQTLVRVIGKQMIGITVFTVGLVASTAFMLRGKFDFLASESATCSLSVAFLASAVMVARSPSSALAIIAEMGARGPVTKTLLGVTVVSDVALLVFYAITASLAESTCSSGGMDPIVIGVLVLNLVCCVFAGYLLGKLLVFFLWIPGISSQLRGALILPAGYGVFIFSAWLAEYSEEHWGKFVIELEGLLVCMVASCIAGNQSPNRRKLANILHKSSPYIFLPFFTLTGAAVNVEAAGKAIGFAFLLFTMRMVAITAGSLLAAQTDSTMTRTQGNTLWATLTTQDGAALAIANQITKRFHQPFGSSLGAAIVANVIMNQIIGPPLFKWAIRRVGEDHSNDKAQFHLAHAAGDAPVETGAVAVIGVTSVSLRIAKRLPSFRAFLDTSLVNASFVQMIGTQEQMQEESTLRAVQELVSGPFAATTSVSEATLSSGRAAKEKYPGSPPSSSSAGLEPLLSAQPIEESWEATLSRSLAPHTRAVVCAFDNSEENLRAVRAIAALKEKGFFTTAIVVVALSQPRPLSADSSTKEKNDKWWTFWKSNDSENKLMTDLGAVVLGTEESLAELACLLAADIALLPQAAKKDGAVRLDDVGLSYRLILPADEGQRRGSSIGSEYSDHGQALSPLHHRRKNTSGSELPDMGLLRMSPKTPRFWRAMSMEAGPQEAISQRVQHDSSSRALSGHEDDDGAFVWPVNASTPVRSSNMWPTNAEAGRLVVGADAATPSVSIQ